MVLILPHMEGFSNDVLYLIQFLILTILVCVTCQCCQRSSGSSSFPNRRRSRGESSSTQITCPICFEDDVGLAVTTNCGHSYCDTCFGRLARDHIRTPPRCPLCR
jgi:hypothetical protein